MKHPAFPRGITRETLIDWYRSARERTRELFAIPKAEAYHDRPIPLRHPIVFYEGHLPAFAINTLLKLTLGRPGLDAGFEVLFERGIDPESVRDAKAPTAVWPSRSEIQAYGAAADEKIVDALANAPIEEDGGEGAFTVLEHELMHHETLLYMFHNMRYERKVLAPSRPWRNQNVVTTGTVNVPAGTAVLGGTREDLGFGWDNESPPLRVDVPSFDIDRHSVTNGQYLQFVTATAGPLPHFWERRDGELYWRGLFERRPLPLTWPVWVTHEEAEAYARWVGRRLPTEAEYDRAAFEDGDRRFPWGNETADITRGNFDFASFDPVPIGSFPAGASVFGVHDLVGNGWEWTSSLFEGFPGFKPMASYRQYSTDFFDRRHYVLKGASPVTDWHLIRRTFRNWFRPNYPYLYAKFRTVR